MRVDEVLNKKDDKQAFFFLTFLSVHPFSSPDVRANFQTARYRQILF
jgi:hypothetical protein